MAKVTSNTPQERVQKTRNWGTIVYPESAPENWQEILADLRVAAFVSPIHDKDKNPNGEPKKAHYHVMMMFEGPKEQNLVKSLMEKFGGVGCEYINSARSNARYFCHLDNPDKAQYKVEDVKCFGGANYTELIATPGDKYKLIAEMMDWCETYSVEAYSDLITWARVNREDWFQCLCDNGTYVMKEYLKSKVWKQDREAMLSAQAEDMRGAHAPS